MTSRAQFIPTKEESNSHTKVVNNFAGAVGIFSLGVFVADTFLHLDNSSGRIFLNVFTVYKNVLLERLMYIIVLYHFLHWLYYWELVLYLIWWFYTYKILAFDVIFIGEMNKIEELKNM